MHSGDSVYSFIHTSDFWNLGFVGFGCKFLWATVACLQSNLHDKEDSDNNTWTISLMFISEREFDSRSVKYSNFQANPCSGRRDASFGKMRRIFTHLYNNCNDLKNKPLFYSRIYFSCSYSRKSGKMPFSI